MDDTISHNNFLSLAENMLDGLVVNQEGWNVFANQGLASMLGYESVDELLGTDMDFLLHPSVADEVKDRHERRKRGEPVPSRYETLLRKKDGTPIVVELHATMTTWDGRPAGMVTVRDISHRRSMEEELNQHKQNLERLVVRRSNELMESEVRLARIVSSNPNVIYTLKPDDGFPVTFVSDNVKDLFGFSVEQCFEPGFWAKHLHPDEAQAILAGMSGLLERDSHGHEYRFRLNDDSYIWIHDELRLLRDGDGNPQEVVGTWSDITERKLAQEKYRILFDLSEDAIMMLDREGFIDCNPATLKMFGCKNREEFMGKHPSEISPPVQEDGEDSRTAADERIATAYEKGHNQFEWIHRRADGSDFPAEVLLTPMVIGGRDILQAIVRDITRRRQIETALRESEKHFRQMADQAPALIWMADTGNLGTWYNKSWLDYTGRTMEQELGFGWIEGMHPDDREHCASFCQSAFDDRQRFEMEFRLRRADGSYGWIADTGIPLFDNQDTFLGYVGYCWDITDRKQAELELQESQARLDTILNALTEVVWAVSLPDYKPLYCSQSFEQVYGRPVQEWLDNISVWEKAVHPDDEHIVPRVYAELETEGRAYAEYRLVRPDESVVWVSSSMRVVLREQTGPAILIGIVQDITQRRQFEKSLIEETERAEEASQAKTEFLSRMSHELRTPMNAILGFGQLLQLDADRMAPDHRDSIRHIIEGGEHLLGLINEVLDISRVDAGKIELSMAPVQFDDALQSAVTLVAPLAVRRGVEIRMSGALCNCNLMTDRQRLIQVLVNLMSNAVKYNREQGEVDIVCKTSTNNKMRIEVRDSGHGIRTEDFDKIFEPFQRVPVRGAPIEGTGIGLTITKKIVELMGGKIGFESEYGKGSTFWFELPLSNYRGQGDEYPDPTEEPSGRIKSSMRLLYVEDNLANRKLVTQLVGRLTDCVLVTAGSAEEGIKLARDEMPDLVLMDIGLPGMDGFGALKELRRDGRTTNIPVVAVTAHAMPEFEKQGRQAGFDDYITKPIQLGHLLSVIERFSDS